MNFRFFLREHLRNWGLIESADHMRLVLDVVRNAADNRRFKRENPNFAPPPHILAYDAYGTVNHRYYHESGKEIADFIYYHIVAPRLHSREVTICEWGCGPARIIRHLPTQTDRQTLTLYGSDYNPDTIAWAQTYIPNVRFHRNQLAPPLPFADAQLDFIYSTSVFTHLSEPLHALWLTEMYRVVRKGGYILMSLNGTGVRDRLTVAEQARFDAGKFVVREGVYEGKKHFNAYHPDSYVRNHFLRDQKIIIDGANCHSQFPHFRQSFWLIERL